MSPRSENIEKELLEWATEALELRHGEAGDSKGTVGLPSYEAGLPAAVDMLQRVRVRLDRVEELQSKARQAKGRVMRTRENADFEAQLAYDQAMQEQGNSRVRAYVTGAEKNADASLASLEQKRAAHQIRRIESIASEVLDVVGHCYWGLEKLREDILQMMRLTQFTTSEEVQT